ncbi:retrotransposable element Tf2 [Tanacetum coccineum]|uniref:Retrotransposable element Tf2 n=1 Tax=Tanacetum coccineum TaxID=301880 RepID=A0ABQ5BPE2_9ASTR
MVKSTILCDDSETSHLVFPLLAGCDSGHSSIKTTTHKLCNLFYWRKIRRQVKQLVKECDVYHIYKSDLAAYPGLLQPLSIPATIWSSISMDFVEGLLKSQGKTVIFVVVDRLKKYAYFVAFAHPFTAINVAQVFLENIYKLHGLPNTIVSDRDKIFLSTFWKELFKLLQVNLHMSTAYHPQTNGQNEVVEVVDRTLIAREAPIDTMKFHLKRAQDIMKSHANKGRSDRQFKVGDWVYLKLQPHRQVTVRGVRCLKKEFFLVFNNQGVKAVEHVAMLERRLSRKGNATIVFVLVQWSNRSKEDAIWESIKDIHRRFP